MQFNKLKNFRPVTSTLKKNVNIINSDRKREILGNEERIQTTIESIFFFFGKTVLSMIQE